LAEQAGSGPLGKRMSCQPDERGDRRAETVVESQEGRRQWCTDGIRSQPDRNKTERKVDTVCTTLHRGPILENSLIRGMTDEAQGRAVTPAGQSKEPATGPTGRRQAFVRSLRSRAAHAKGDLPERSALLQQASRCLPAQATAAKPGVARGHAMLPLGPGRAPGNAHPFIHFNTHRMWPTCQRLRRH